MSTLIYAPEVTVRIRTSKISRGKGQVIDVSEDISSGSVTRITNGISTAQMSLLNQNRKYDEMFSPMDTIVVYLRRLKTVLKFAGYLDAVPLFAAEPGSVNLTASCTLKRLANFMWDPGAPTSSALLDTADPNASRMEDGGVAQRAINVLTTVAGWEQTQIHIARIPTDWYDQVSALADRLVADAETLEMTTAAGGGSWIGGVNGAMSGSSTIPGIGAGTGTIPATSGKSSTFGGPGGGAYGNMALTGESGSHPRDGWYCAMRWPYTQPGAVQGAKAWWVNRHILVTNPATNKSVVVRAADWGPASFTGRVIDLAPQAMRALGGHTDQVMHIGFAPQGSSVGPVLAGPKAASSSVIQMAGGAGASGHNTGWGSPGDTSNQVRAHAQGCTWTCHRLAKVNFEGFVNDLANQLGYHPKSIGGFNNRNIAGTGSKSNHAWGAAIDIDPARNPRYGSSRGGPYALPHPPAIISLARKWGLGWGGEYRNSKDYMHFEVIGAPASNAAAYKNAKITAGPGVVSKWTPPIHNPPGYKITKHFGDGGSRWVSGAHSGTDFATPEGTPIYPVGPGVVHNKGSGDSSYGNWISIDHGNKNYTFYAHMNSPSPLSIGTHVDQSTVIGHVGQTGNATGPHVHVEYRKGADTYNAAVASGGIEKYVLGGANRSDPPAGVEQPSGSYSDTGGTTDLSAANVGQGLFNVFQYDLQRTTPEGMLLGGYRAVMNDVPVLDTVGEMMTAGMRDFSSAPNGDFIAWWPDYFGHYKQAGKMVVSPLEINQESGPPTVGWDDTNLKTHQFVAGASTPHSDNADTVMAKATTAGVASIEFPELMQALFKISKSEAVTIRDTYMERYGARPDFTPMNNISGHRQEFFFACYLFQQNWTQQYQASVQITFMPEVYPGMLLCLPSYGIQGYVRETTDSWDLRGGGFSTTVTCAPWSTIAGKKNQTSAILPRGAAL